MFFFVSQPKKIVDEYDKWFTVGIFKGLTHTVSNYIDYDDWNSLDSINLNSDNLPELQALKHANLEPGRAYRFRISGINACGRGEWSEVSKQLLIFCFEHFSTNNHFDKKKIHYIVF
jgi:hypothetical protein